MSTAESAAPVAAKSFFAEYGYAGPYPLLSAEQAGAMERLLRSEFKKKFEPLKDGRNRHFDLKPIAALCRLDGIIERVAELLGPNLLLWRSQIFFQSAERAIPWHHDLYTTMLDGPGTHLSIHVALSPATENDCVAIVPRSHRLKPAELGLEVKPDLTPYGNRRFVQVGTPPEKRMTLRAGEFFIFHPNLVHRTCCSERGSEIDRVAIALRIATPDVRVRPEAFSELPAAGHGVLLLAGEDPYRFNQLRSWPQ